MLTMLASAHREGHGAEARTAEGVNSVWGLTTLCLKPFMTAAGANARQAVRRLRGGGRRDGGLSSKRPGESQANSANAVRRRYAHARFRSDEERRAQIDMGEDACRDRGSLVLGSGCSTGVGEAGGAREGRRGEGRRQQVP
jgi:hypothetical protein